VRRHKMPDIIVLLPGITGSVLEKDGATLWGFSAGSIASSLISGAQNLKQGLALTEDPADQDDLGDAIVAAALIPDLHLLPGLWKIDGYTKVAATFTGASISRKGRTFLLRLAARQPGRRAPALEAEPSMARALADCRELAGQWSDRP
jgi:hypothetical protein